MTELSEVVDNLSPPIMDNLLTIRDNHYNLRSFEEFWKVCFQDFQEFNNLLW